MVDINTIIRKISSVKKYLKLLESYKKYTRQKIELDPILRGSAERYLYLACQAAIDLGEAVISFKNFRKPGTYSEIFYILAKKKPFRENWKKNWSIWPNFAILWRMITITLILELFTRR